MTNLKLAHQLAIALAIRVTMAPFLAHPYDMYGWFVDARSVALGQATLQSYMVPYSYALFLFAFPAYAGYQLIIQFLPSYTFSISSVPAQLNPGQVWNITLVPGIWFDLLTKLPLIASDLTIGYIIYVLVMRATAQKKPAELASFAWLFNPLVIWVSAGWGMFDTLPALFMLGGVFALMRRRPTLAGLVLGGAAILKVYPLVALIPISIVVARWSDRRQLVEFLASFAISFALLLAPEFLLGVNAIEGVALNTSYGGAQLPAYFGLTFWNALTLGLGLRPGLLYLPLLLPALAITYLLIAKRTAGSYLADLCLAGSLPVIALLLFFPLVGENFPLWFFPFVIILTSVLALRARPLWVLSVVGFIFSITDSLLPFFLLPVAIWFASPLTSALSFAEPYRIMSGGTFHPGFGAGSLLLIVLGLVAWGLMLEIYVIVARATRPNSSFSQAEIGFRA